MRSVIDEDIKTKLVERISKVDGNCTALSGKMKVYSLFSMLYSILS